MGAAEGQTIVQKCLAHGFALAGVCEAKPSQWRDELRAWLAAGSNGDMHFLEEDASLREDPSLLTCVVQPGDNRARDGYNENVLPVKSFIVVADQYAERGSVDAASPPDAGRIARYARGKDYHHVMKRRLHSLSDELRAAYPREGFVSFVDTVPLPERELAMRAGLGWIGKHTLLIHRSIGSWFFLGGIGTSLEMTPPTEQEVETDRCGTCTRCIDACPTQAITERRVEATRCISYLTIEHQGLIPQEHHGAMGEWLYGCDICQEVCPHNSPRSEGGPLGRVNPDYRGSRDVLGLAEVLGWTEADRNREFRGSAMKRVTLDMMKRNAIIAAGNSLRTTPNATLMERIGQLRDSETEETLVRETARIVLERLENPSGSVD